MKADLFSRAERKKRQVCSPASYQKVFDRLDKLPTEVEHLVVLLGILFFGLSPLCNRTYRTHGRDSHSVSAVGILGAILGLQIQPVDRSRESRFVGPVWACE